MPAELGKEVELEIAHVLFLDIVGYSKVSVNDQHAQVEELNRIVRASEEFRKAEIAGRLLKIATGDGMALIFYRSPEEPVRCAVEISRALKEHSRLQIRMGIHSGPVSGVVDVNERTNVAGAGINMAQRVMSCGDAGHILLSKHVADDLQEYEHWRPLVHDLGTCEVKHGARIGLANFHNDEVGNSQLPKKLQAVKKRRVRVRWAEVAIALLLLAAIVAGIVVFFHYRGRSTLAAPEKSIAVLPFENRSEDKANAYFADGVQDEILTYLAKIADLKVISRTSVMQYKTGLPRNLREIGQQLGVAHLLEGSVQRAGGKVRVNAQLIDARNDAHLWAQTYDRELADVFAIQSEIAKTIAEQLQAKISPNEKTAIEKPPTRDLDAYDLYLQALGLRADSLDPARGKDYLPKAAGLLNDAVTRDPKFLLAWCLLAKVHSDIYFYGHEHTPERLELCNQAVQTALRIQPDAGEAHLALAYYYYHGFRDYGRAREELAIARRTLPNNAEVFADTAYIDRREGRWEEGTRNLERSLELDPRNFFTLQGLAQFYEAQRRYGDETRILDRALTIVPGDPIIRAWRASIVLWSRADIKSYQVLIAKLISENPGIGPEIDGPEVALCERTDAAAARGLANYPPEGSVGNYGVNLPHAYWEGVVARWQGDRVKAKAAFAAARSEMEQAVEKDPEFAAALSFLGLIDAGLGRKEEAIREGRRACELLPISKDAVDGVVVAVNLAEIYAWTGEKDLAVEQLEASLRVPNDYTNYGYLRLSPLWDPLRGDPRFEKIVASLGPKN